MNRKRIIPLTAAVATAATLACTMPASATETPQQATCAAFRTWEARPSAANLEAAVRLTFQGSGWTSGLGHWLVLDLSRLYGDWRSGSTTYVVHDATEVARDCSR